MKLSPHFTLEEATFSSIAERFSINNATPEQWIIQNAIYTASQMEIVRSILNNKAIHIDSWIRCVELNRKLGSRDTSQHILGQAVDFICPKFGSVRRIAETLNSNKECNFDQLILEHTWIHVSFVNTRIPRRNVLTLLASGTFATGLTDLKGNPI